jgi:hypothetical protein
MTADTTRGNRAERARVRPDVPRHACPCRGYAGTSGASMPHSSSVKACTWCHLFYRRPGPVGQQPAGGRSRRDAKRC